MKNLICTWFELMQQHLRKGKIRATLKYFGFMVIQCIFVTFSVKPKLANVV